MNSDRSSFLRRACCTAGANLMRTVTLIVFFVFSSQGSPAFATDERGTFPVYGNWCGPGYPKKGENPPVIDRVDETCRTHDQCYDSRGDKDSLCDEQLIVNLQLLIGELNNVPQTRKVKEQKAHAVLIRDFFAKFSKYYNQGITGGKTKSIAEVMEAFKDILPEDQKDKIDIYIDEDGVPNIAAKDVGKELVIAPWISTEYNGWDIGFSGSPGIQFNSDDYIATTLGIDFETRFSKKFFGISYSLPHQGTHRQDAVVKVRDTGAVNPGMDSLKGYFNVAGLGLGIAGKGDTSEKISRFLSSAKAESQITWGYGSGKAKRNSYFAGHGATLSNRVISGNITQINRGQSISFVTKFVRTSLDFDLMAAYSEEEDDNTELRVGGFHVRYRRPTNEANNISDFYNCAGCSGWRYPIYDAEFSSYGVFVDSSVKFDLLPLSSGQWNSKLELGSRYALGKGEAKITDTDISLYNKDLYYWGLGLNAKLEIMKKLEGLRSLSLTVGGHTEDHIWDTRLDGPWDGFFTDVDRVYSVGVEGKYRF